MPNDARGRDSALRAIASRSTSQAPRMAACLHVLKSAALRGRPTTSRRKARWASARAALTYFGAALLPRATRAAVSAPPFLPMSRKWVGCSFIVARPPLRPISR